MAVVARSTPESFRKISPIEALKSNAVLGNPRRLGKEPIPWLNLQHFSVLEAVGKNGCVNTAWPCLFQHCNHQMECRGNEPTGGSNCEVSDMLPGFSSNDMVRNSRQNLFVNTLELLLIVGRISFGSKIFTDESLLNFESAGDHTVIVGEEIDGDRDDRQKTTDSKQVGDEGKIPRSEGASTSSSACGTGDGGSTGDDGGDDDKEGGRRESGGGPLSATDEAMEEDEEKEDGEELEGVENVDGTGVLYFMKKEETPEEAKRRMAREERERERERVQARLRAEAEARVAAAEAAAAKAAAAAAAPTAATAAAAEGSDDEAVAGPSRSVSKTDAEDPEEVGKMKESPETPSEGTPSQSPSPPPDVTDANDV